MTFADLPSLPMGGPPIEGAKMPWAVTVRAKERDVKVWWHPNTGTVRLMAGG